MSHVITVHDVLWAIVIAGGVFAALCVIFAVISAIGQGFSR